MKDDRHIDKILKRLPKVGAEPDFEKRLRERIKANEGNAVPLPRSRPVVSSVIPYSIAASIAILLLAAYVTVRLHIFDRQPLQQPFHEEIASAPSESKNASSESDRGGNRPPVASNGAGIKQGETGRGGAEQPGQPQKKSESEASPLSRSKISPSSRSGEGQGAQQQALAGARRENTPRNGMTIDSTIAPPSAVVPHRENAFSPMVIPKTAPSQAFSIHSESSAGKSAAAIFDSNALKDSLRRDSLIKAGKLKPLPLSKKKRRP